MQSGTKPNSEWRTCICDIQVWNGTRAYSIPCNQREIEHQKQKFTNPLYYESSVAHIFELANLVPTYTSLVARPKVGGPDLSRGQDHSFLQRKKSCLTLILEVTPSLLSQTPFTLSIHRSRFNSNFLNGT